MRYSIQPNFLVTWISVFQKLVNLFWIEIQNTLYTCLSKREQFNILNIFYVYFILASVSYPSLPSCLFFLDSSVYLSNNFFISTFSILNGIRKNIIQFIKIVWTIHLARFIKKAWSAHLCVKKQLLPCE